MKVQRAPLLVLPRQDPINAVATLVPSTAVELAIDLVSPHAKRLERLLRVHRVAERERAEPLQRIATQELEIRTSKAIAIRHVGVIVHTGTPGRVRSLRKRSTSALRYMTFRPTFT